MRRSGIIFLIGIGIFLSSCASPARYTREEIKDYPPAVQERITKGEITFGMTPQQVRYSWGSPDEVRILKAEEGKQKEEWVYSSGMGIFKTRLTFIDGKLVYIITSEWGRTK
jgi:hypothetical protein